MNKTTTLFLTCIILAGTVSAQEITIKPETYTESITAGQNITEQFQVSFEGETTSVIDLETEPSDLEGLNISYDQNRFIIEPGETVQRRINIVTSEAFKPDELEIKTKASTQIQVEKETDTVYYSTGSSESDINQSEFEKVKKEYNETLEKLNETNQTKIEWKIKSQELENSTEQQNSTITDLQKKLREERQDYRELSNTVILFILVNTLLITAFSVLMIYNKREKIIQKLDAAL